MKYVAVGITVAAAAAGLAWWMRSQRSREAVPVEAPVVGEFKLDDAMVRRVPNPDPKMVHAPHNPDPRMVFNSSSRSGDGRAASSNGRKM